MTWRSNLVVKIICVSFLAVFTEATLELRLFTEEEANFYGARCLDGSPAGFYFEPSLAADGANKWVFFLGSGGFCYQNCAPRTKTPFGSSKQWSETLRSESLLHPRPDRNPKMWSWNHVFIQYCSGDYWSGRIKEPSEKTMGYYFSGHNILKATIQTLIKNNALDSATHVMLTGQSSGGFGVFVNADYVARTLSNAQVVAAPHSGLFLRTMTFTEWSMFSSTESTHLSHQHLLVSENGRKNQETVKEFYHDKNNCYASNRSQLFDVYDSYANVKCLQSLPVADRHLCLEPTFVTNFIDIPLFVIENLYDSDQIFNIGSAPLPPPPYHPPYSLRLGGYLSYFAQCMHHAVIRALKASPKNGLFVPSCLHHVAPDTFDAPFIHGSSMMDALDQWMTNGFNNATFIEDDLPFGLFNPSCQEPDDLQKSLMKSAQFEDKKNAALRGSGSGDVAETADEGR